MMITRGSLTIFILFSSGFLPSPQAADVQFNRDIRPILSDNCFKCHGPDEASREAKLRLDLEEEAKKEVIAAGESKNSELAKRITATDPNDIMPPPDSGKSLSPEEIDLLVQWIDQGAPWQGHWAYIPPVRPEPPASDGPVQNAIDQFIQNRLGSHDLTPSPEADKQTLLRRLSLDLTGLPPTSEEIRRFLRDNRSDAYEKQVDRLLDSPQYGERMAVPWLDLVRYADTVGYHGDQNQNIFPYRDYVINSFNENKSFDQFTIEQLAGDLLPNPTTEQLVATGFNRLNMMTREGGAQPKEYLAKYASDRVRTVSTAWLASTMACAECHDHKFDPFTARDFYSMAAFFADLKQWGVYADYGYTPNPDLRGFNNDYPFPPEIKVASDPLKRRIDNLQQEVNELTASPAATRRGAVSRDDWEHEIQSLLELRPSGWEQPSIVSAQSNKGTEARLNDDGSLTFLGEAKKDEEHAVTLQPLPGQLTALRVQVLPTPEHDDTISRDKNTFSLSLEASIQRGDDTARAGFFHADADFRKPAYSMGLPVIGVLRGWESDPNEPATEHTATYWLKQPERLSAGDKLILTIRSADIARIKIAVTPIGFQMANDHTDAVALGEALAVKSAERNSDQERLIAAAYFKSVAPDQDAFAEYLRLQDKILECRDGEAFTMITETRLEPMTIRVLPRGNWQDDSGPVVDPAVPEFLAASAPTDGEQLTRLDLARWITSQNNPLAARAFVNRLWSQFFGQGLSRALEDIGSQGEWPTHPELLDWLAVEFMESGWDVKHMVKLMVMSHTYRQSSNPSRDVFDADPYNKLLARQSPRRLPAEFVRDNALAIAGLLNREIGGPSAHPYQPAGYYAQLNFPTREYQADTDSRQYRRGLYSHWQRTFLHPMLANFDAPSREECTAGRTVSNTPQQALTLLNDPSFVEAARHFAQELLNADGTFEQRLDLAFTSALSRSPTDRERASLKAFHEAQLEHYQNDAEAAGQLVSTGLVEPSGQTDPIQLAAWTSVCRAILNLHETITRY